ncbi:MAG TPA: hypothetical protein PK413_20470, partial [Thermoanaerobaculia bacterium]|nr:hypothetical protein [Thermoanaerobaculia bacterium]
AQESFLFYPPRPPINPYMPPEVQRWWEVFGREQAAAFDQKGWSYYTGEWSEEWYPGYTNSWASYRGAVGILYEQAGIGQGEVVRGGGDVLAYRDTVARPATGALASLSTLAENRKKIARDYLALRRRAVAAEGPFAGRYWAVLGDGSDRLQRLGELLRLHGLAVFSAPSAMTVENAGNALGELRPTISLPAGTLLIPARQPEAHLAGALLDFDLKLDNAVLARERQEVMRHGRSLLYDVSAWSLPLLFDLETWLVPGELPAKLKPFESASAAKVEARLDGAVALVAGGQDDASLSLALRWLERGLAVRWADRSFELSGKKFARGSLLVARSDQRRFAGDALAVARDEAARQECIRQPHWRSEVTALLQSMPCVDSAV